AVLAQRGREDEREERDADRTPAEGPAAGRERRRPGGEQEEGGEEPARDEERRADVRERRPELRADSVPGAVGERVHHAERGDADRRVAEPGRPGERAEQAAAEPRGGPDEEGEEAAEAEQLDVRAGPAGRPDRLRELVGDVGRARAERVR